MEGRIFSLVYGTVALLSVLLLVLYAIFDKRKKRLFLALFACVAIANCGFFMLSISKSLAAAKLANGLSYFGGAFSMLVMLLVIGKVCQMRKRQWIIWSLTGISAVFLHWPPAEIGLAFSIGMLRWKSSMEPPIW